MEVVNYVDCRITWTVVCFISYYVDWATTSSINNDDISGVRSMITSGPFIAAFKYAAL